MSRWKNDLSVTFLIRFQLTFKQQLCKVAGLPWYSYPSQCHSLCLKLTDLTKESYECLLIRGRVGWAMAYLPTVDGKLVIHTLLPWTTHVSAVKHTVLFKLFLWFCSCKFWFEKSPNIKDTTTQTLNAESLTQPRAHWFNIPRDPKFDRLASYGDLYGLLLFSGETKPVRLSPPSGVGLCSGFVSLWHRPIIVSVTDI